MNKVTRATRASLSNWKTTAVAVLIFIGVAARFGIAALDNDPTTVADANEVVTGAIALLTALGFLASRDADKRSEDSGLS